MSEKIESQVMALLEKERSPRELETLAKTFKASSGAVYRYLKFHEAELEKAPALIQVGMQPYRVDKPATMSIQNSFLRDIAFKEGNLLSRIVFFASSGKISKSRRFALVGLFRESFKK